MRPTLSSLTSLVRSVLLTEARNTAETFLSYTLGSDTVRGGNENECRLRRSVVARMIADPELKFASFSSLAEIIVKQGLFKPSPSASAEEWVASVKSAWQGELDEVGIAELTKDLGAKLSPKTQSAGRPDPEPSWSASAGQGTNKRKISPAELQQILALHREYLRDPSAGKRADLMDADLMDANLSGANLSDADFIRADLRGAILTDANLTRANLRDAILTLAHLSGANLTRADLEGARLSRADLSGAYLTNAYLTNVKLWQSNLTNADLTNADLTGANLWSAKFTGAILTRANFKGANLSGAYLEGADLKGADLSGANLSGATYNSKTMFPSGFDPVARGMVLVK